MRHKQKALNEQEVEKFQSTHPSGVRLGLIRVNGRRQEFQSTHPSGVRQKGKHIVPTLGGISIHAPQWGATEFQHGGLLAVGISIHAPQWGATILVAQVFRVTQISIHAPQWGATRAMGVDVFHFLFQSTHPSGVRHAGDIPESIPEDFNPRTPVGCDVTVNQGVPLPKGISIHAPQWGATWRDSRIVSRKQFQSTHPSGVRPRVTPMGE